MVPQHEDPLGRQVITIRSSGMMASMLTKEGLVAEAHRDWILEEEGAPDLGTTKQATLNQCALLPNSSQSFAWFDSNPQAWQGGLKAEIQAMNSSTTPVVTLATTIQGRPVLAVRVGSSSQLNASNVPTVYVLGTHHAREWIAEEVTMRLLRWARSSMLGTGDAELNTLLQTRALVFVPVVNPDGYQYSRSVFREQRKNRNGSCPNSATSQGGVDINRNYAFMWNSPADSISINPCSPIYVGPSAASEPETQGIQYLLGGQAFASGRYSTQRPVAAISYHSYGDFLLYPEGLKPTSDTQGFACGQNSNCLNPDFHIYRRLFGDTEFPILTETTTPAPLGLPLLRPYQSNQGNNVLYTVSGDFTNHAQYGVATPMLAVTPELTSDQINFYIECESNPEAIVSGILEQQKTLLKRILNNTASLVSNVESSNFAASNFGKVATGGLVREVSPFVTRESARPSLVHNVWKQIDTGPVPYATVSGVSVPLEKLRTGVHYNGYGTDFRNLNPSNPYCLPCFVGIRFPGQTSGVSLGCSSGASCVDLTDPGRLPRTPGWQLASGPRPGTSTNPADIDYWWRVTGSSQDEILTIPASTPPNPSANCLLSFTTEWVQEDLASSTLLLERKQGAAWTSLTSWNLETPFVESRRYGLRLRSYVFEANSELPSRTPEFRFRLPANRSSNIKIFEPVVLCRTGSVP